MQRRSLFRLTLLLALCITSLCAIGQTVPAIGGKYYIAAQGWDGTKYVEHLLYMQSNAVHQTKDINQASVWDAFAPGYGSGIALRAGGKYLMRGGITSAAWGSIISEPTVTLSDPPAGSVTIKSTVTNYAYYIIAPNGGTSFTAVNAASEASYQPKTSLYTPYFKFYDATKPLLSVKEAMSDGSVSSIGAEYVFTPSGQGPKGGNLWPAEIGRLSIDQGSYNHLFYTFMGFKVAGSEELQQSIDLSSPTKNMSVTAVFAPNPLDGENFTFINASPSWYANQQVYKAIYLDTADQMLKWKTYDPADPAFYFTAHGSFDNLTFESVAVPGKYITGPTTAVADEGASIELRPLGAGDYAIIADGQHLYAYGSNNGRAVSGTLSALAGTAGTEAAWEIQSANDPQAEALRYQQALEHEAALVAEGVRQEARMQLLAAINSVTVGDNMGNVPRDAYDLAVATYENNTLSPDDYTNAIKLLYSSCRVPGLGTKWRIINKASSGQVMYVGLNDALKRQGNKSSLYQIWIVDGVNPENPTQLAMRNLGSGTYLDAVTQSSNSPSQTTSERVYVDFIAVSPGVFMIQTLSKSAPYIYFCTSPYGDAIITGTSGEWRVVEVSPTELDQLSAGETARQETRQALLTLMNDARRLSSQLGAIGYYTTLASAISTAKGYYDDPSLLKSEYEQHISNLQTAIHNASITAPEADATYIICDHDGRNAMQHEGTGAIMSVYDDTDIDHFWKLSYAGAGEGLLPWEQTYTLTSIEGKTQAQLTIRASLQGNDEYYITIDGDEAWNSTYGQTPLSFHKASKGADQGYLVDNTIYRIRNVSTGQALVRSTEWPARVAVEDVDETLTDYNQLWRVEKQQGADRYQLHNIETNRHIEEQMNPGSQLVAAFTPGTWHLKLVEGSEPRQFKMLTTMAPMTQLAIAAQGNKAVAASEDADNTVWVFEPVEPQQKEEVRYQVYKILSRYVTETQGREDWLYADKTHASHSASAKAEVLDDYTKWVMIEKDGKVALRNVYSSLYINPPMGLSTTPFYFEMRDYTDAKTGNVYTVFVNPSSPNAPYLCPRTNVDELINYAVIDHSYPHWTVIAQVEDGENVTISESELLDNNDAAFGFDTPHDGAVMRIYSYANTCLDDYYKQNLLQHKPQLERRYAQLWRMHQNPVTGLYKFENIYTGSYIMNSTNAGQNIMTTQDEAQAGEFAIARNKSIGASRQYNILDANLGIGMSSTNMNVNTAAVNTDGTPGVTEWRFIEDHQGDAAYAAMRENYYENKDIVGNARKYDAILAGLFADKAYTRLRDDVTEQEIEDAIAQLPDLLVDMVLKIRDNAWPVGNSGNCWEQIFRIQDYRVSSNSGGMAGLTYAGYSYSQLNEPTGIMARPGDIVAVMVEEMPEKEAALKLEMVEGLNRSGTQVNLVKGLNLVQISELCNLFIYYQITGNADDPKYYIERFPNIKIHIEGGEVYGCIDRTREMARTREDANRMWAEMQADGLILNGPMCQIKHESIILNFNSKSVVAGCPVYIGEVSDIWDDMIKVEQHIMGLRDEEGNVIGTYIPNLDKRFNNRWMAYERTGGYMNANGGGAQYSTGTITSIMNFENIKKGGLWGPAHEHGHDMQVLINMCGMTEVSNNLFSNVANYDFGVLVSRGTSLPDAGSVYAKGGHWFDNNIWTMTQMYYKLYLYYHVAGHKPTFYPEVFAALYKNRLLHSASVPVPADRDYLQFALICSQVAGEDLSEFFEAYGMMRPTTPEYTLSGPGAYEEFGGILCRIVGDYSTYHVYATEDMIAQARAEMAKCGPKNGNIMFIEDRVRQQPSTSEWAQPGQMRGNRGDGGTVGAYGNVGQWEDFTAAAQKYAHDYTLTKEWTAKGVVLHISGEGGIGYKLYGPAGELVYFSAFNDMLLPAQILEKYDLADLVLVIAQADGTSVELACDEDQLYTVTTYHDGNSQGNEMKSAGRFEPELRGNDVCVVTPTAANVTAADYAYSSTANVIMAQEDGSLNAEQLEIADKVNIYLPSAVNVGNAVYTRDNTAGWNSVCLPVAASESDFGEGSKIYTISGMGEEDGGYVLTLKRKYEVEAGEPCFVWCPEEMTSWEIVLNDVIGTTDITPAMSDDGMLSINGSMVNATIGAGKYKLNSQGTAFGATTDNGSVTAMRSYIENNVNNAPKLKLRVIEEDSEGVATIVTDQPMENGRYYDLNGRELPGPSASGVYIYNGKVYLTK